MNEKSVNITNQLTAVSCDPKMSLEYLDGLKQFLVTVYHTVAKAIYEAIDLNKCCCSLPSFEESQSGRTRHAQVEQWLSAPSYVQGNKNVQ